MGRWLILLSLFKPFRNAQKLIWQQDEPFTFAFLGRYRLNFEYSNGWWKQESIAREDVQFFTADWAFIGSKQSLAELISKTTGISKEILLSRYMPAFSNPLV
jgi:hypothetical protein